MASIGLIVFSLLMMALPSQAQLNWGVKGGLNLSKVSFSGPVKDNLKSDNTTGFFIGPMAEFTIPIVGLGIDGALMYSQRGDGDWKQQGLEIPVNLKYTIGLGSMLGIYLSAGPNFFFNFKENEDVVDLEELDLAFDKKKAQVSLSLGLGVKLVKHLQVGINYLIPMGDSFDFNNAVDMVGDEISGNGKTKTWQVSAAYIF